jgi:transposase InsO family protein
VYLVIVFLSVILPMLLLSSKLKRNLIIAQNLTIFIDDFSWKSWIFFMKTKGQVFNQFQEFKALVENQTGKKIRVLRTDNGGEYTSKEFMEFCVGEGIRREWTVPYNP